MSIKLTTPDQVARLRQGDLIMRYPDDGTQEICDESSKKNIETYEIRSINPVNQMMGLVMAGPSLVFYALPVDIGRLFIKSYDLITEKTWWV